MYEILLSITPKRNVHVFGSNIYQSSHVGIKAITCDGAHSQPDEDTWLLQRSNIMSIVDGRGQECRTPEFNVSTHNTSCCSHILCTVHIP